MYSHTVSIPYGNGAGDDRIVLDADGNVRQVNNYYPFGLPFAETFVEDQGVQPYKYGNKELDQLHGMNIYDSQARMYFPDLPHTTTMDPLAEKYYNISPYVYCLNNPVKYVDRDGKQPIALPMPVPPPPVTNTPSISYSDIKDLFHTVKDLLSLSFDMAINSRVVYTDYGIMILPATASSKEGLNNQKGRERAGQDKQNQQQANVSKSIDANITGMVPNGDPAPKRDPNDGDKKTKVAIGISAIGATAGAVQSIVEGSTPQNDGAKKNEQKQPDIKPQEQKQNQSNQSSSWWRWLIPLSLPH